MKRERLLDTLMRHEGLRLFPYKDSVGKLTIGVGRNIEDNGISEAEALHMLNNDVEDVLTDASRFWWFGELNDVRQEVVLNMLFNMGLPTFKQFQNMIGAIEEQNWNRAAQEMLNSRWAKQVGVRAIELSDAMRKGEF